MVSCVVGRHRAGHVQVAWLGRPYHACCPAGRSFPWEGPPCTELDFLESVWRGLRKASEDEGAGGVCAWVSELARAGVVWAPSWLWVHSVCVLTFQIAVHCESSVF